MKKIVFCIDSFFQMIVAIDIKIGIYKDWEADIIIYNTSPIAEKIYFNLKKMSIFKNVYITDSILQRVGDNYKFIQKFPKYFVYLYSIINADKYCKKMIKCEKINRYDIFMFHGHGAMAECIFNTCYHVNPKILCYRIDDGLGTYIDEWSQKSIIRIKFEKCIYKMVKFVRIEKDIKGYYVAEPDLVAYKLKYELIKIPKLDRYNDRLVNVLNTVFDYHNHNSSGYMKKKVIFFGAWGNAVKNDLQLLNALKKVINPDDILIKMHPREERRKYESLGIQIDTDSFLPWELIMLNARSMNQIFITSCSSAVMTSRLYFRDEGYDIFAYRLCDEIIWQTGNGMEKWVKMYQEKYGKDKVFLPDNMEEFLDIVKRLVNYAN